MSSVQGLIGKHIGRYLVVEHLGRGGMAEVYKAFQPSLDRYVAIKVMHGFLTDDKDFLARFEREAKAVAALRHPSIVQVFDYEVESGLPYMVMEFIDGVTLKTMLENMQERGEWVSLDDAVQIVLSLGSALRYAHERHMVHRDVKPANVMITSDGHVILTDFGIAKILSVTGLTASGAMIGTPTYMSPEQGMGQPGDERSDIYSLGVMLYQLVVGQPPYDADTPLAVIFKHINEPVLMPRALKADLPEAVERVILKALAKRPEDRYSNVAHMTADLKRAMGIAADVTPTETMRPGSAIRLSGVTMAGSLSGAAVQRPAAAAPPAPSTVVAPRGTAEAAQGARPEPVARRPAWLIPLFAAIGLALVVGAIALIATGGKPPDVTPSLAPTAAVFTPPEGAFKTESVALRVAPGLDAPIMGEVGPASGQFVVIARSGDAAWLKIQFRDGTTGWAPVAAVDFGAVDLNAIPVAVILSTPTAPPTDTPPPSDTPAPTDTLAPTDTSTPTATATHTRLPTRRPTAVPPARTATPIPTAVLPPTAPPPPPPTEPPSEPTLAPP